MEVGGDAEAARQLLAWLLHTAPGPARSAVIRHCRPAQRMLLFQACKATQHLVLAHSHVRLTLQLPRGPIAQLPAAQLGHNMQCLRTAAVSADVHLVLRPALGRGIPWAHCGSPGLEGTTLSEWLFQMYERVEDADLRRVTRLQLVDAEVVAFPPPLVTLVLPAVQALSLLRCTLSLGRASATDVAGSQLESGLRVLRLERCEQEMGMDDAGSQCLAQGMLPNPGDPSQSCLHEFISPTRLPYLETLQLVLSSCAAPLALLAPGVCDSLHTLHLHGGRVCGCVLRRRPPLARLRHLSISARALDACGACMLKEDCPDLAELCIHGVGDDAAMQPQWQAACAALLCEPWPCMPPPKVTLHAVAHPPPGWWQNLGPRPLRQPQIPRVTVHVTGVVAMTMDSDGLRRLEDVCSTWQVQVFGPIRVELRSDVGDHDLYGLLAVLCGAWRSEAGREDQPLQLVLHPYLWSACCTPGGLSRELGALATRLRRELHVTVALEGCSQQGLDAMASMLSVVLSRPVPRNIPQPHLHRQQVLQVLHVMFKP